ncbi:MAG: hypothetical protein H6713_02845 [Myxococcales bacterium]|nr:hypothetical protein [Myxococcales bacterium]
MATTAGFGGVRGRARAGSELGGDAGDSTDGCADSGCADSTGCGCTGCGCTGCGCTGCGCTGCGCTGCGCTGSWASATGDCPSSAKPMHAATSRAPPRRDRDSEG